MTFSHTQVVQLLELMAQFNGIQSVHGKTLSDAQQTGKLNGRKFKLCTHSLAAYYAGTYGGIDFSDLGSDECIGLNLQNNAHRGKITFGRNTTFHNHAGTSC